jgi:predicted metal-dependent peptidase
MTIAQGRIARFTPPGDARAGEERIEEQIEEIARSRVERARIDILLEHPYFAAALLAIPLRGTSEDAIPNAVATDGARIVYRFDLVAAVERPKVRRMILHALAHVLLKHPERGGSRDWSLWTAACDIAVEELFDSLGIRAVHGPHDFARFRGKPAEAIYAELEASRRTNSLVPAPLDGMVPPLRESNSETLEDAAPHPDGSEDPWSAAREAFDRATADATMPTPRELAHLQHDFRSDLGGARERSGGTTPGNGSAEIDAAREQVCWRQRLARFMREPIDREWSFARPNRKHLWRGLYLPGPMEIEGGKFVVAIDTSGSMSDRALSLVLGEVDAIRRSCACELTVLQFDATIHAKAEFSRWSDEDAQIGSTKVMRFFGRGGTDLRLPFTWAESERRAGRGISALIVCTDGYGPLPPLAPDGLPVLFILTPAHSAPAFGEKVVLSG